MIEPSRLAAYISSYICHDIISPVSSINLALEMLEEPSDAAMTAQYQELLEDSSKAAGARIQLLRYAFGSAGLSDSGADLHEVKKIVEAFIKSHKPSVEWNIQTGHFSCGHARVLMNLTIMAIASLPRGGVVALNAHNEGNTLTITASGRGPRAKLKEAVTAAIDRSMPEEGWNAQTVQPFFAQMVIDDLGGKLAALESEEAVTFIASGLRSES